MPLTIKHFDLHLLNMRTRMPFKYGIATLTALPHLFFRVTVDLDGATHTGLASDGLAPKWFTKNPASTVRDDLEEMLLVIREAGRRAVAAGTVGSVYDLWAHVHAEQQRWAADRKMPPLLAAFGVSLLERATIDAYCRAKGTTFAKILRAESGDATGVRAGPNLHKTGGGGLGIRLGELHAELAGASVAELLPPAPREMVAVRHTVGLADPLTDGDIPPAERVHDGLPQSLEACLWGYGLRYLKIKLSGDPRRDVDRLRRIAGMLAGAGTGGESVSRLKSRASRGTEDALTCRPERRHPLPGGEGLGGDFAFTLDGNEQYHDLEPFRELWAALTAESGLKEFLKRLIVVEQPLHRDVALSAAAGRAMHNWTGRPPMIIDESDALPVDLETALACGYVGTSHKNCKGVCKGIAHACLLEQRRRRNPGGRYELTGEDLASVGPVAMLQDLAAAAAMGIGHVERNGHHYFAGLSMYPPDVREAVLARHGDLYRRQEQESRKTGKHEIVGTPLPARERVVDDDARHRPGEGSTPGQKGPKASASAPSVSAPEARSLKSEASSTAWPTLDIRGGMIRLGSVNAAPFGVQVALDPTRYTPADEWRYESLGG